MAERELHWIVDAEHSGARLDRLVARAAQISRRLARTLIATGRVRVNGEAARILSRTYGAGRVIEVAPATSGEPPAHGALKLLYEDRQLVVVNKPPGLLSESTDGARSVIELATELVRGRRLWLVHRLDANTSGVLVLARTSSASARLGEAFRAGRVRKDYLALCAGVIPGKQEVNAPIGRAKGTRHSVTLGGKPASTVLQPLAATASVTLVHAQPRTGRTHQIRVHLTHLGHPILGDALYGGPRYTDCVPPQPIARMMLHAARLTVPHPATGDGLHLAAPLPQDFIALCEQHGLGEALEEWRI